MSAQRQSPLLARAGEPAADVVDELLRRRAERLRVGQDAADSEAVVPVAEFCIRDEVYAILMREFLAVAPLRLVTPVPLADGGLIGVLRFQGRIIKALSLASLLGTRGWHIDPRVLLVVAGPGGQPVGLDCEQIPKPAALPQAALDAAKAESSAPVVEIATRDKRLIRVIDVDRLLRQKLESGT